MFSSHTIYTMSLVCAIFKYYNFKWLKLGVALLQIAIVPFILAARKHYSVDVFTALYVTPMVFEILLNHFPDHDTSLDMSKHYGIQFYLANGFGKEGSDPFSYAVSICGREFYVEPEQLPIDIRESTYGCMAIQNTLILQKMKSFETQTTQSISSDVTTETS